MTMFRCPYIHICILLTLFLCHYPFFLSLPFIYCILITLYHLSSLYFHVSRNSCDRSLRAVRNNQKERKTKNRSYQHRATKYDLLPFAETFLSPRKFERKFHIFLFHQFSISSTRVANSLHSFVSRQ